MIGWWMLVVIDVGSVWEYHWRLVGIVVIGVIGHGGCWFSVYLSGRGMVGGWNRWCLGQWMGSWMEVELGGFKGLADDLFDVFGVWTLECDNVWFWLVLTG
ncbi:hypothetical protein [Candidatus Hodgkinia cicadicola]|uniref:hypothetical protein n=1 Tax=Candidatus Hodgkinia cicadicola TaxID=573658 RepID=UPI0011BACD3B